MWTSSWVSAGETERVEGSWIQSYLFRPLNAHTFNKLICKQRARIIMVRNGTYSPSTNSHGNNEISCVAYEVAKDTV